MSWAAFGMGALGRLVGNLSDTYGTGDTLAEKRRKDAESDALAMERQGIVARVEGAKAAGLHPLVAMNYQGGYSPSVVMGGGPIQSDGAFRENPKTERDPNVDRINAAAARRAEAEADMAELAAHNAYRNLGNQPGNPPPASSAPGGPTSSANLSGAGLKAGVQVEPDKVTAGVGGVTAGRHPGSSDVDVPGYGRMRVPSGKLKEALEDNEVAATAMLIALNRSRWWKYLTDDIPTAIKGSKPRIEVLEEDPETTRLRRRHPPKGDYYISPRSRGGVVR